MRRIVRFALYVLLIAGHSLLVSACAMPGGAAPIVKIGVIAPFEGVGRPLGYAMLPAVKAAVAEANAGRQFGSYRVALVALNDDLDPPTAARQAQALAQDTDLLAVIGPSDIATAQAAAPILAAAGIPTLLLAPVEGDWPGLRSACPAAGVISKTLALRVANTLSSISRIVNTPQQLVGRYAQGERGLWVGGPELFRPWVISQGGVAAEGLWVAACAPEGLERGSGAADDLSLTHAAALAGYGTRVVLDALAADIAAHGRPSRAGTATALAQQAVMPGVVWFQVAHGRWVNAPP